jgi:hypothetical protein
MSKALKKKVEVNQELTKKYTAKMTGIQAVAFTEAVEAANELVNQIENADRVLLPVTQHNYGIYMQYITSLTEAAVFLCAGAPHESVSAAAKVNGLV